jgi:hypothetical protein
LLVAALSGGVSVVLGITQLVLGPSGHTHSPLGVYASPTRQWESPSVFLQAHCWIDGGSRGSGRGAAA